MKAVEDAVLVAMETGNMNMQELFNQTPFHCVSVTRAVEILAGQGKLTITEIKMNNLKTYFVEFNHA